MDNNILYIILATNVVVLALNIFFLFRLNLIKYLIEQPVIKKVSPHIKLKPVKVDRKGNTEKPESRNTKSNRGSGRSPKGRSDRGGRGRNNRNTTRTRPPQTRGTVETNSAAEKVMKPENDSAPNSKNETPRASGSSGRRPLTNKSSEKTNSRPAAAAPTSETSSPEPAADKKSLLSTPDESVKHGRRNIIKKAPVFEEEE